MKVIKYLNTSSASLERKCQIAKRKEIPTSLVFSVRFLFPFALSLSPPRIKTYYYFVMHILIQTSYICIAICFTHHMLSLVSFQVQHQHSLPITLIYTYFVHFTHLPMFAELNRERSWIDYMSYGEQETWAHIWAFLCHPYSKRITSDIHWLYESNVNSLACAAVECQWN